MTLDACAPLIATLPLEVSSSMLAQLFMVFILDLFEY